MGKSLVIAEKPSVATDIARVLKAPRDKSKDFFENDDYVISSAVGHLLTIIVPPDQDIKRGKWTFDKPIFPCWTGTSVHYAPNKPTIIDSLTKDRG